MQRRQFLRGSGALIAVDRAGKVRKRLAAPAPFHVGDVSASTEARHALPDPAAVRAWLDRLAAVGVATLPEPIPAPHRSKNG